MASMEDPLLIKFTEQLDIFCKEVEDAVNREQIQLEVCEKNIELKIKLAQELKTNERLTSEVEELKSHESEIKRACAALRDRLVIADSDQTRLQNVKDMYEVAKQLTGVRFDYSATTDIAVGYIKNEVHRALEPFSLPAGDSNAVAATLWDKIAVAAGYPIARDKENRPPHQKK